MVLRIENGESANESSSSLVNWKLEKTPEPKFVEDGAGDGLDSLLIGQNVSDVQLSMFDDSSLRLGDEGRVIILDFWATWCAPCIRSLPRLVNLAKQYPDDKVRFIGVNVEENEFTIQGFLSSRGIEMEVATDLDASLANKFGVKTIPQTIIIHKGKVERHFVGAPADLHEKIAESVSILMPPTD
jgi:thiol-disulfide isomerase/thioredoxin